MFILLVILPLERILGTFVIWSIIQSIMGKFGPLASVNDRDLTIVDRP
jgi:hypothetical protein